jgi:hypothetical protein
MSCGSGLTGLMMVAGGAMVTNGTLAGTFGAAPLSSLAGAPLSLTDAATGLTNFAPTLSTMTTGLAAISGVGAPLAGMGPMLSAINGAGFSTDMLSAFNSIPTDLGIGGGLFDAIGGFAPSVNGLLTEVTGGSGVLNDALKQAGDWAGQTLGGSFAGIGGAVTGAADKFGTILNSASSYVTNANQMISAATNSTALGSTFTGLNNIVSGSLAGVNLDFSGFGAELAKVGGAIDFDNLSNLGNPGQLLSSLEKSGTLGPLYAKLGELPIDPSQLTAVGGTALNVETAIDTSNLQKFSGKFNSATEKLTNIDGVTYVVPKNQPAPTPKLQLASSGVDLNVFAKTGASLPKNIQKEVYNVLDKLNSTEVSQIKGILGNTQEAIQKGTDLLDPKKLFPDSFQSFTAPLRTASLGFRSIYQNETGSVNPEFESLGNKLQGIVPDDLAIANGALSRSLLQVKNINETNNSDLGAAVGNLETLKDLDLLENQSTYVTASVRDYWTESFGVDSTYNVSLATGNAGQLKLSDVIGFAAGYNSAAPITKNSQLLAEMSAAGELDDITGTQGVYDTINKFCAGDFGPVENPPASGNWEVDITAGYVGAGTYTGLTSAAVFETAWISGIVPAVKTILASFSSNTRAIEIMSNSERWNQQLAREYLNQQRIDNDLTTVRASQDVALNLALNLPNLGLDTSEGGTAELLERVVDFSSLGGQAVIASMREGRNLKRLADANIQQDTAIDTTGVENPASLTSSQYSAQQAKDKLITS